MAPTPEQRLEALGTRVKVERERQGLTMVRLAAQADVGVQTLVRIEAGNPGMGALNLMKVLDALGLDSFGGLSSFYEVVPFESEQAAVGSTQGASS